MIATGVGKLQPALGESQGLQRVPRPPQHRMAASLESRASGRAADFTLQIAPMLVELAPQVVISTIGYNNKVPGPLLRMREGQHITVDVVNETDVPEYVHWHGLFVPSEVDGVALPRFRPTAGSAMNSWPGRRVRDGTIRTPQP